MHGIQEVDGSIPIGSTISIFKLFKINNF